MNEPDGDEKIGNEDLYRALKLVVVNYDHNNNKKTGHGTGFIVRSHAGNSRFGDSFLVTNRHVVDRAYRTYPFDTKDRWLQSSIESIEVKGHFQYPRDEVPTPESVSLKIHNPEPVYPRDEDIDIAVIALSPHGTGSSEPNFHTFDIMKLQDHHDIIDGAIQVGSPLLMPGYPQLGQEVSDRPILVGGWIASDPRYSASMGGADFPRRILGHSFSRAGMSGAPVLSLLPPKLDWKGEPRGARLTLLGINTGHVVIANAPSVMSQFVPAPAILSTIARAGDEFAVKNVRHTLKYPEHREVMPETLWLPEPLD